MISCGLDNGPVGTPMNRLYIPFVSLLLACPGDSPEDTGPETSGYRDVDRDGYNEKLDCDDYNAYVNPGEPEYCDGIDNNCDGLIDGTDSVDVITWYRDVDSDHYGAQDAETVTVKAGDSYYVPANHDAEVVEDAGDYGVSQILQRFCFGIKIWVGGHHRGAG